MDVERLREWWWKVRYPMAPEWLSVFWYELTDISGETHWVPWWRRHKRECYCRFNEASERFLAAAEDGEDAKLRFRSAINGFSHCGTCDYIRCSRTERRFWFWVSHIEGVIECTTSRWKKAHRR